MDADDGKTWYFAYGSNLCVEQMERRTGPINDGEKGPRIAHLAGYRLVFNMQGDDGQVYANITQPGAGVIGVLYRCNEAALARLDVYEEGYDRRQVEVTLENGQTLEAMVYIARPQSTASDGVPSADYLRIILRGAKRQGLPEAYIASIEAQA